MEDQDTGKIVGSCAILSSIGCVDPFLAFQIKAQEKTSFTLKSKNLLHTLQLHNELRGPSELGSLFLLPEYRGRGCGRLLSLSRFLFMAAHPDRFSDLVVAEMRGVSRKDGYSPFYEAVGKHFLPNMTFPEADYLVGQKKSFVNELFTSTPLYIDLLPAEAQEVIGKAHPETVPALKLLQSEGFQITDLVDVMDAGPKVSAPLSQIRTVKESTWIPSISFTDKMSDTTSVYLICSGHLNSFKVTQSKAILEKDKTLILPTSLRKIMMESRHCRCAPLYPAHKTSSSSRHIMSFPHLSIHGEVNLKKLVLKELQSKSKEPHFLRRFSEWYQAVATSSKTNG